MRPLALTCDRCHEAPATMLLAKGLVVCDGCFVSPEDVSRTLPRRDRVRIRVRV